MKGHIVLYEHEMGKARRLFDVCMTIFKKQSISVVFLVGTNRRGTLLLLQCGCGVVSELAPRG